MDREEGQEKEFVYTSTHNRNLSCPCWAIQTLTVLLLQAQTNFIEYVKTNGILKYSATLSQKHFYACIFIYKLFKKYFQIENVKSTQVTAEFLKL